MSVNHEAYHHLRAELDAKQVTLVAVSKTKPVEDIKALYDLGHRDFGENYVQELTEKVPQLPNDIRWHYIGHLQRNKVKFIAPFIHLIHGIDSLKLLDEVNNHAIKSNRTIDCLLQMHIATEESKFGLDESELNELIQTITTTPRTNIAIKGLMGMASFTTDTQKIRSEFHQLKKKFDNLKPSNVKPQTLSMGMSSDYRIAIEEGSTMVRIGSLIFGERG